MYEVRQTNAIDGANIKWELFRTDKCRGRVLLVPGLTSRNHQKYKAVYDNLADSLTKIGFEVLTMAIRGQLGSGGKYSFPNAVSDIELVIADWLKDSIDPVALFARSSGSPIALRVAQKLETRIDKVLLWGASPKAVYDRLFGTQSDGSYIRACLEYGTTFEDDFIQTLFYPEDEIGALSCPVWLGIGTEDEYSKPTEQIEILLKSKNPKSLLYVLPHTPHAVSIGDKYWDTYFRMIDNWLSL